MPHTGPLIFNRVFLVKEHRNNRSPCHIRSQLPNIPLHVKSDTGLFRGLRPRGNLLLLTLSTLHRQLDFRVLSIGSDLDPDPETLSMKHLRTERVRPTPKLFTYVLVGFIALLGLTCLYYGSSFAPGSRKSDEFDGSNHRVRTGIGSVRNRDGVLAVSRFEVPKSVPVRESNHLILIE